MGKTAKGKPQTQAAQHSRSLAEAIRKRFAPVGGVNLPELRREPIRMPPSFR